MALERTLFMRYVEQMAETERLRAALEAALWLAEDAHPQETSVMRARFLNG